MPSSEQISQLSQPKAFTSNAKQQQEFVTLANKVGAIVCTKVGAMRSVIHWKDATDQGTF
ncbi:hypothetical protein [Paenibacillus sp. F4]|uniref:hypothetical protein n=1 Tax=Paenibacillus sp. F4 TaxID=357385 RepID=UPI000AC7C5ED|nr:hypothetical protein [Paenibacillus sp. F4]